MIGLYFRVSTDKQKTDAQRHDVFKWCEERGYSASLLLEYVDDGLTGSNMDRPGLESLLNDVKEGKIQKIITFESSRLSRDFMDFLNIMATLNEHRVELEIPSKGVMPFESSAQKLILAVEAFQANQFLEVHRQRILAGLAAAKRAGKKIGAPKGNKNRQGKFKTYSPERLDAIVSMAREGRSTREIGRVLGLSQSKIVRLLKKKSP